jgi:hypothetical protein
MLRESTASPAPEPSPSTEQLQALNDQVSGLRSLYLYSGGVAICLLAMLAFRIRSR